MLNLLLIAAAVLGILLLAGVLYQAFGSARDARKFPPYGRLVDVNGRRMHIYTTGEGTPTVVLDAALGGSCLSWALVQGEVAKFTRVCSYDRAGLGWSDASPLPRTAQQSMKELRALLHNAGVPGPYLLVGHSFGGFVTRLYASTFPGEVAGLVLVDVPHPREWTVPTADQQRKLAIGARLSRRGAWAVRLGIARFIYLLVQMGALRAARSGVAAVSGGLVGGPHSDRIIAPVDRLPAELRPMLRAIWIQPKFFESLASQMECVPETAQQLDACGDYGDLPLIVLSASNPSRERVADQEAVARLSTRGNHVVASRSGHWIPLDQPALVVDSIREVVDAVRRSPETSDL